MAVFSAQSHVWASDSTDDYINRAAEDSSLWPVRVGLVESAESKGRTLDPGLPGVLIRVEDGQVLIDMGRRGVHWVALDKTDFYQRSKDKLNEGSAPIGNYFLMFGGAISLIDTDKLVRPPSKWQEGVDQLLFVYAQPENFTLGFADKLRASDLLGQKSSPRYRVILMPQTDVLSDPEIYSRLTGLLVMSPAYSSALTKSFDHFESPVATPAIILVDANGKIIERPNIDLMYSEIGNAESGDLVSP
ncbi:hypothetical protein [Cerasicoccus arenae]|uniref:Uncharacterized protein n=2 Tax=Cerasicoccus arenae TaxID=424488 RepID=A0A8J3DAH9_9BACT|nr:hypothetical protein [Cerasicoccus arenae]MBK1858263.1 hypothetical protein [Cerasicoccus arenae]GHC02255.1 hypothetical protein GCM10007047_18490 [Cerasicoccus arenae]